MRASGHAVTAPAASLRPCMRAAFVGLTVMLLPVSVWAQGQLTNPGFEDSGGSLFAWQTFGNITGNVTVSSTAAHTGSWAASVSGPWGSGTGFAYAGLTQGVSINPETTWTASAYVLHTTESRLEGGNQLVLKVEFYRRFGGAYGTADFIGETVVTALDSSSIPDVWHRATVGAQAPYDAVEARVAVVFVQEDSADGTALIDDVDLSESGQGTQAKAWSLFWSDEFDGDTVDTSKWKVLDAHLIKNNELQYYDPEDVYLDNGCLVLRSRRHDPPVVRPHPDGHDAEFEYTSGLVETPGLFSRTFGWIEVRAKLPSTQGIWPAHWLLGDSFSEIGWPRCGEIDLMELLGHDVDTVYFTRHWGEPYAHSGTSFSGPDFSEDFHTFAVDWSPEEMRWYVDGSLIYQTSIADAGEIFQNPFYLILNTAVGGNWPGFPDHTTVFPQYHEIDYVRWYVESEPGDFDLDGDVDFDDQAAFATCFSGVDLDWQDPACRFFDMDADGDVDCDDWDSFGDAWNRPPPTTPVFVRCELPGPRRSGGRVQ